MKRAARSGGSQGKEPQEGSSSIMARVFTHAHNRHRNMDDAFVEECFNYNACHYQIVSAKI